jgi:hypothetical protein
MKNQLKPKAQVVITPAQGQKFNPQDCQKFFLKSQELQTPYDYEKQVNF